MTKYLNAEEMLNNYEADCEVYENNGDSLDAELWMVYYLKNHSSADVQPVVHCKDCIHRHKPEDCVCPMCSTDMNDNVFDLTEDDNFCKYGNNGDEHD